jgi:hypothetical protein
MNNEQFRSTESSQTREAQEVPLTQNKVEQQPPRTGEQMIAQSEKEVATFKSEGAASFAPLQKRAEQNTLDIEKVDADEWQGLETEAETAREILVAEIDQEAEANEAPETRKLPSEQAHIIGAIRDANFPGSVIIKIQNTDGRMIGYALRRKSNGELEGNTIAYLSDGSVGTTYQLHASDFAQLRDNGVLEKYEHTSPEEVEDQPVPVPTEKPDGMGEEEPEENERGADVPILEERVIENPQLFSEREASKRLLTEQRIQLAREIREQRSAQGNRLLKLQNVLHQGQETLAGEEGDRQSGRLAELQSTEANLMAERISARDLSVQDAKTEQENMRQLIANSETLQSIKDKIRGHYAEASATSKERFETIQKSITQTALRNGVFFVHTIQEGPKRHNELSNVANEATYADDADILLSLEPTISASSIFSGKSEDGRVSGLWSDTGGFILGGGDIQYADRNDVDSLSEGIKKRTIVGGLDKQAPADIDHVVSKRGEIEARVTRSGGRVEAGSSYNEFIINNPKVFGYYQPAATEEDELFADGKYYAGDMSTKNDYEELLYIQERLAKFQVKPELVSESTRETPELYREKLAAFQQKIALFQERFAQMAARGTPLYIMTPDKILYQYHGVNEDGSVNIGEQLTPEEAATGRAGLSGEKRKQLGERVLQKKVFKQEATVEEAHHIIRSL